MVAPPDPELLLNEEDLYELQERLSPSRQVPWDMPYAPYADDRPAVAEVRALFSATDADAFAWFCSRQSNTLQDETTTLLQAVETIAETTDEIRRLKQGVAGNGFPGQSVIGPRRLGPCRKSLTGDAWYVRPQ